MRNGNVRHASVIFYDVSVYEVVDMDVIIICVIGASGQNNKGHVTTAIHIYKYSECSAPSSVDVLPVGSQGDTKWTTVSLVI